MQEGGRQDTEMRWDPNNDGRELKVLEKPTAKWELERR